MATLILEVGVPGCGKSYFAEQVAAAQWDLIHVSSDMIREDLWGDASDQREPQKVFDKMYEDTLFWLREGYDVIYDATNIHAKFRRKILEKVRELDDIETICLYFDVPLDVCLDRAASRERQVPERVIHRMYSQMEPPQYDEGWDYICRIEPKGEKE